MVAAWWLHAAVLPYLAEPLIVDQSDDDYQFVCVMSFHDIPANDWIYERAARLYHAKPSCRILVVQPLENRLVELGIVPTFGAVSRRELTLRGVPDGSISIVQSDNCGEAACVAAIRPWLSQHPDGNAILLCSRFYSARIRSFADTAFDPDQAVRVRVCGVPRQRGDETNWWKSRDGYKVLGDGWLRQLCHLYGGSNDIPVRESASDYQRRVLESFSEETP